MFCIHKFDKIEDNGYQYCTKCNTAIVAPCPHKWENLNTYTFKKRYSDNRIIEGMEYHLQCTKCGDITKKEF